jgi:hypothetical protein
VVSGETLSLELLSLGISLLVIGAEEVDFIVVLLSGGSRSGSGGGGSYRDEVFCGLG